MPYLVQTGSPSPWFQATNDSLDTLIGVAGQDRARRMQEEAQIRGEDRANTRQIAGEGRQQGYQIAGENRSNTEWGRRFGVQENAALGREQRGNQRQDALRNEGYQREAAGGGAMMNTAIQAGLVKDNPMLQAANRDNMAPGPTQGAVPMQQILQALAAEQSRRNLEQRQTDEAGNIIGAASSAGMLPVNSLPNAQGPAPLPRFLTPGAAQGYVNDAQQNEHLRVQMDAAGAAAAAADRRQTELERHNMAVEKNSQDSSFNRGGERDRHAMMVSLTKTAEGLQGKQWFDAATGWLNRHFGSDWDKSPEAIKAGVVDAKGNPNVKIIGDIVDAQIARFMTSGPQVQRPSTPTPKPQNSATESPLLSAAPDAENDPEAEAMINEAIKVFKGLKPK